ncbi:hypothetical protein D3C78_1713690 [compost metagenome]
MVALMLANIPSGALLHSSIASAFCSMPSSGLNSSVLQPLALANSVACAMRSDFTVSCMDLSWVRASVSSSGFLS